MTIQETVIVEIATVEVNDDYRVELAQLRKVVDYSPEQAIQLANELITAASGALVELTEHLGEVAERSQQTQPLVVDGTVVL